MFDVRNQFVIRNNAARNDMIELAFEAGAEYALPWDGNCFMNERAWTNISAVIMQHGLRLNHTEFNDSFTFSTINKTFTTARTTTNTTNTAITLPNSTITDNPMPHNYFFVPMARIIDNLLLINSSYMPPSVLEEPQLIFSRNALERFDESKPYGRRPKVDLLWRLRIPGPWGSFGGMDRWRTSSDVSEDRPVLAAGWTARLSSGVPNLEGPGKGTARGASRTDGVERISAVAVQRMLKEEKGVTFNETMTVYNRDVIDGLVGAVEKDVVERMEIEEGGRGGKERESDQMMVEEGNKQETENKQSEAKEKEERKEMVTARILATLLTLINGTIPDSSVTSSLLSSSSSPNSTVISNTHHAAASTLRTSTTTSFQNASSSPLSAEAIMLFRIRANAAVHAVFRWMLLDHSESARLHARAALADAFVVNATRVAMNVRDHAMTVCALLDAARVATWDGGVWLSDDNDDEKKELNDVNGVDWARELVNVLEKDEMAPYYSSKERELAAELERAEAEDGNDNINIDSDLEMGSESSISTNRSTTTNTSISILTTTASFNSSIDSDRPLFYRRGADGIAFELCAACAHIFLSASSFHSPNSTVDDFHMVLRRTALAAQRLAWYVDMDGLADVSDLKAVDDSTKHEMSDAATLTMDTRTLGLWILHAAVSKTVDVDVWGYGFEPEVMKRAVTEREKKIGKKERGDGCYGEDEDECKAWLPMLFDRALRFWDDDYDDERKNENNDKRFRKDSETDYSVSEDEELWRMWIRWTGRCARKTADELESEEMKEDIDNDERRTRKQIADMSADDIVALELGGRRAGLPPFWTLAGVNCRWTL